MLVITPKPSLKNTDVESLKKLFVSVDPAITIEVTPTKIIANRTCDELFEVDQQWSLNDVWQRIEPLLNEYFNKK